MASLGRNELSPVHEYVNPIIVMSHERHSISARRKFDCLFNTKVFQVNNKAVVWKTLPRNAISLLWVQSLTHEVPVVGSTSLSCVSLHWRHNEHASVSNHQPDDCLLNHLFRRRSKKTSKLRVTGLCAGNSPGPVNSPHKGPVSRKMFPFDYVIMSFVSCILTHWMSVVASKYHSWGFYLWVKRL